MYRTPSESTSYVANGSTVNSWSSDIHSFYVLFRGFGGRRRREVKRSVAQPVSARGSGALIV